MLRLFSPAAAIAPDQTWEWFAQTSTLTGFAHIVLLVRQQGAVFMHHRFWAVPEQPLAAAADLGRVLAELETRMAQSLAAARRPAPPPRFVGLRPVEGGAT
jgi:hypothetical protein